MGYILVTDNSLVLDTFNTSFNEHGNHILLGVNPLGVRLCNNIVSAFYKAGGGLQKTTQVYIFTSFLRICLDLLNKSFNHHYRLAQVELNPR